jgi:hypothetical protein
MIADTPEFDPIAVWQGQASPSAPLVEDITERARAFEARNRRRAIVFGLALGLHLAVSLVEDARVAKGSIWWVGVIRFALFTTWVLYLPFRPGDADDVSRTSLRLSGLTPVLDFYRRQLERQRNYFQDDHHRKTRFIALAVGFVLYSIFYPSLFLVFGIPIIVGAAAFYRRRRAEAPEIQHELEILQRLRKEFQ